MFRAALLLCLLVCATPALADEPACPPAPYDRAVLLSLRENGFAIEDPRARRDFAEGVTACLASPDPILRDGIAYEALTTLLRGEQLNVATQTALTNDLVQRLQSQDQFEAPFAALALSEVVRAERLHGHYTDYMREDVLNASIAYFTSVRDYRGFDETEGWRHGVAHGADLLMQLSLNESYHREDLARIRDAIATQITPDAHFYIYGETERLARPILMIAQRGVFTPEEWTAWFETIAAPAPLASWDDTFKTQQGLAKHHNLMGFLFVLHANASLSEDENIRALLPGVEAQLRALP